MPHGPLHHHARPHSRRTWSLLHHAFPPRTDVRGVEEWGARGCGVGCWGNTVVLAPDIPEPRSCCPMSLLQLTFSNTGYIFVLGQSDSQKRKGVLGTCAQNAGSTGIVASDEILLLTRQTDHTTLRSHCAEHGCRNAWVSMVAEVPRCEGRHD